MTQWPSLARGYHCRVDARSRDEASARLAQQSFDMPRVFACGDLRRGQSLVAWAIWEGREAERGVDPYLMAKTDLPAIPMKELVPHENPRHG